MLIALFLLRVLAVALPGITSMAKRLAKLVASNTNGAALVTVDATAASGRADFLVRSVIGLMTLTSSYVHTSSHSSGPPGLPDQLPEWPQWIRINSRGSG